MFANPVSGTILPAGSAPKPPQFRVTSPFGPRDLNGDGDTLDAAEIHKGMDLGNGGSGAPVYAQAAGTVVEYRPTTDGVVTIQTANNWRLVAAHMTSIPIRLGSVVKVGQRIGSVGAVGAKLAHLHVENKQLVNGTWVPRDPWPLLNQNGADMTITILRYPALRQNAVKVGSLTGYRPSPAPTTKTATWTSPSAFPSDAEATFNPLPAGWPAGPYQRVTAGAYAGYYLNNAQVTLGPLPAGGFTQADIDKAEAAAAKAVADAAVAEAGKYR